MLKAAKDSPAQGRRTPRTQNILTASQPSVPGSQWDEEARPLFEAVPLCMSCRSRAVILSPSVLGSRNTWFLSQ